MTKEEAISLLTQVNKIIVNNNSWLESTYEPLNTAFAMAIEALKTQKVGKWETGDFINYASSSYLLFKCSECKLTMSYKSNYCPTCGARMEETE